MTAHAQELRDKLPKLVYGVYAKYNPEAGLGLLFG